MRNFNYINAIIEILLFKFYNHSFRLLLILTNYFVLWAEMRKFAVHICVNDDFCRIPKGGVWREAAVS